MVLNVEYASEISWNEVCKKVNNALVFLDDCSAECLHWHGGLNRILKAGAVGVKEFSSFEGGSSDDKKAVFLVKSPLVGPPRMILRDIISNSKFEHCIVITSCSPIVLNLATTGNVSESSHEQTALHKLEHDILHWMKNETYIAEIFYFPYGFLPVTEYFFVTPAFNDFFPCFEEDLEIKKLHNSKGHDWDMESLPLEMQMGITYLMTTLNSLLSQLNVREDIYCLGPLSTLVGSQLQKYSTSHLRSKSVSSMSLLLVDRTLDLCGPVFFDSNCFMDCMKSVLPTFPTHSVDIAVNMSCLTAINVTNDFDIVFPGCLHEPKVPMLDWLYHKSSSDILNGLSVEICKILSIKEKIFTPAELENIIIDKFARNVDQIRNHSGILQLSLGVIQTLKSNELEKYKLIRSFQILVLQALASNKDTIECVQQTINLVNNRREKGLELEHLLVILIFLYAFIGDKYKIDSDLEALLMTALGKAVTEDKDKYSNNENLNFDNISNVDEFCGTVLKKLHSLKGCRSHLTKFRDLCTAEDTMMPMQYKSVMTQLFQEIINPSKPEIPDLRHKPNLSLRDNFASRFSMLLNSARPHITDSESLLVFFIGGITGQEVNLIKNYYKYLGKPVIIGSTAFLSPTDVIKKVFINNPLKPLLI